MGGSEDSDPSLGEMGPPTSRKCQQSILHMPTAGDGSRDLGVEGQPGVGLMFKLDLEKAEEPEIKLPTSAGS